MAFDLATAEPVAPKAPNVSDKKGGFDIASAEPVAEPNRAAEIDKKLGGMVREAGRQVGLTARAGLRGGSELVGTLANAPAALYNEGANAVNSMRSPNMGELVTGKERGFRFPDQTKLGDRLADFFNLPKPEGAAERVVQDVASGMTGAGTIVKGGQALSKAATPLAARVGEVLASQPGAQVVAGGTGPGVASVVRENGGGPVAQTAAGVAGSFVPALPAAAEATMRGLMRGGESGRQRVIRNIQIFEDAGAGTPTVGQATEGRGARATESVLARTPGGAGTMVAKAEDEATNLGAKIENMAGTLAPETGAEPSGRAIKTGIEEHVKAFKEASGKLYDKVDELIHPDSDVGVGNTRKFLAQATAINPKAQATSKQLLNQKLVDIRDALESDLGGGTVKIGGKDVPIDSPLAKAAGIVPKETLPYETLKNLRTKVGGMLESPQLTNDIPRAQLKRLYGALTQDMQAAAKQAGPEAEAALVQANNHHRQGMTHIEDVLQPIVNKADPEKMFLAATSGTKEGATTIKGVMGSLPEESRKVVAGTMLKRLGTATPGKQNEVGDVFSTETFLTNWNKLHPEAKKALFASLPSDMRSDLDQISKVASNIREGSKVFANPSGTAQASLTHAMGWGTAGAAVMQLAYGRPLGAAATVGTAVGGAISANLMAKAMTSPKVVHWLAETTKVPESQLPAQLNNLFQQSLYMKGDERRDTRALIKEIRTGLSQEAQATPTGKEVPQ